MTWQNELREEIKLTSPKGNEFYALWKGNEKTTEKKLGLFDTPKSDGTIVQDLGTVSDKYPLTIYFDGPFHTTTAKDFALALKEVGQWEIIHPVKGPLILQLITSAEAIHPIENGGYTEFSTEWLEPANIERIISASELGTSILTQVLNTFDDALTTIQQLRADAYSFVQSSINMFTNISNILSIVTQQLTLTSALAQESFLSSQTAFTQAISVFSIDNPDTNDVGNSLIDMALAPIESNSEFPSRFSTYENSLNELYTYTPTGITEEDYNKIIAEEFGISIFLISIAQIVASSEFSNRSEVIAAIENLFDVFNTAVNTLEEVQDNFATLDIDLQYFSQTTIYNSLINLYTLVYKYLLSQFFSLSAERRFTIKTPTSPLDITVQEYESLGDNDENYNLFLSSNQLHGTDILILPAGFEVVIYG